MRSSIIYRIKNMLGHISIPLLIFMLLVMNVKLPVKILAIIYICIINRRNISARDFIRSKYLFFYFSMTVIGILNLLVTFGSIERNYLFTFTIGLSFWVICAVIAYNVYTIIQKEEPGILHNTVRLFFILNIITIFLNFLWIIFETGSVNPYTYKGLNQKYFVSTGDLVSGITLDAPVVTAFICAFGLLYFLYSKQYLLSLANMAAMIIMASNFANIILLCVLAFGFVFNTTRIQKSFILIYIFMLIVFMVKISPDNYEHTGRVFYQIMNKPYDLPPKIIIPLDQLKKMPDSVLVFEQRRKKYAQNYIDSVYTITHSSGNAKKENVREVNPLDGSTDIKKDSFFYVFQQSRGINEKISLFNNFFDLMYSTATKDSINKLYNWNKPGKWIAGVQLFHYMKKHPDKILLGNGIGNFSSRIALKSTNLGIAGRYPERFKYTNPDFLLNHLYVYLNFHSQDQSKHTASNTPDTVYYQVIGEYGFIGLLCMLLLYFGFFARHTRKFSYGLPAIFLLAGAFCAEYWFEQFSIVVLFELLFFLYIKEKPWEEQKE